MKSIRRTGSSGKKSRGIWNNLSVLIAVLAVALGASGPAAESWQKSALASSAQPAAQYASLSKSLRLLPEDESTDSVLPGTLDPSFGVDGTLTVDLGNNLADSGTAVAVQPDGRTDRRAAPGEANHFPGLFVVLAAFVVNTFAVQQYFVRLLKG